MAKKMICKKFTKLIENNYTETYKEKCFALEEVFVHSIKSTRLKVREIIPTPGHKII